MGYVVEKGKRIGTRVFRDILPIKALSSDLAFRIAKELAKEPSYPTEVAKKLGVNEQKVFYHIRKMEKAGIAEVVKREEKKGAVAKYYGIAQPALSFVLEQRFEDFTFEKNVPPFLKEFYDKGRPNFVLVVGSPDPHGPYKARSLEAAPIGDLALFLGSACSQPELITKLDTEMREGDKEQNLILLGGPRVNLLTLEINKHLPIEFIGEGEWRLKSNITGKEYFGDEVGVIEKVSNPLHAGSKIIVIGGNRRGGTRAAIISLIKYCEKINEGNSSETRVKARVVSGADLDGDGVVDSIEFME